MLIFNPQSAPSSYPQPLKAKLSIAKAQASWQNLAHWSNIHKDPTPVWQMPNTAKQLGIGELWIKDESKRSRLDSFKALGAPNALVNLVHDTFASYDKAAILRGEYRQQLKAFGVITATDGNHGRALAAAAQSAGCPCTIVLHAHVSQEREDAIAKYGAQIVRVSGNYDDSVREAKQLAEQHGWTVVSDTSYPGYETIPLDVMQGYAVIAMEAIAQCPSPPTHVLLQGGVGALAAGIASYYWEHYGDKRPKMVVVEPEQADCLYQSALNGHPATATGTVDSFMAGLACGETSPLAWAFMQQSIDYFALITDEDAMATLKQLAHGSYGDIPMVAGESGVAGLALLNRASRAGVLKNMDITQDSRVLVINTEGATAPGIFNEVTGTTVAKILAAQADWLAHN
jgi:diaminopropionate ammonia-lyase family